MKAMRRPLFWYRTIMWVISVIFAGLLIQLGALVMSDVPTAGTRVTLEDFVDADRLSAVSNKQDALSDEVDANKDALEIAKFIAASRSTDYENQRTSFESWIKTRNATGSSDQDADVIARVNRIEALKAAEREAGRAVEDLQLTLAKQEQTRRDLNDERRDIRTDAEAPYQKAVRAEVLKVFMLRLALTVPLLLASAWMIAKKRGSNYWPLYRGFVLFSLFAFFVELVPYLPSYGGYIRIVVGIVIAVGFAHFVIRGMTRYLKNKQLEEQQPEVEKRKAIAYETAVAKISDGVCPSCDRSFAAKAGPKAKTAPAEKVDFCVHCGFCLFDSCKNCGRRDNSFFKFCGTCGVASDAEPEAEPAA